VVLDQVAQRAGPGGGGVPAAGGGLDCPPPLGGQVPGGVQGGQGYVQVPGREGLPGLVGGLGDGRDGPGGLGGDGRVRPRLGAGVRLLVPGGGGGSRLNGFITSFLKLREGATHLCLSARPGEIAVGVARGGRQ
jgi:hypothetical protein